MSNKYSYENVKNKFNELGLQLISTEYINCKQKLQFICPIHKDEGVQEIKFDGVLNRNQGCSFCGREKAQKSRRIHDNIILDKCKELGLNFVNSFVKNQETWVKFTCEKHLNKGDIDVAWQHFRTSKHGCPYCAGKYRTTEDFKKELHDLLPNIEVLGEYKHSEVKLLCRCKIDGHEWSPIPRGLLYGEGCPICGVRTSIDKRTKSHKTFVEQMKEINPNIKIIGEYINQNILIKCRCLIDNCEWESYPFNLLNKSAGCPTCAKDRVHSLQSLSNEEFLLRVEKINSTVKPIEKYYSYHQKLKCVCKIHDIVFYQSPHGILDGKNGCPNCVQSKGEKVLFTTLKNFGFELLQQYTFTDCVYKSKLRFDGYDFNNKITYEFNGAQHYYPIDFAGKGEEWANSQFEINKIRDNIKIDYCNKNNITLIIVPYWELDNIEHYLFDQLVKLKILEEIKSA